MDELLKKIGIKQEVLPGGQFSCHEPFNLWYVKEGTVDVFLKPNENKNKDNLHHFFRVSENQLFFGVPQENINENWQFIARDCSQTEVWRLPLLKFDILSDEEIELISKLLDEFIIYVTKLILIGHYPSQYVDVTKEENLFLYEKDAISTPKGVVWLMLDDSLGYLNGDEGVIIGNKSKWIPLTPFSWVGILGSCSAQTTKTVELLKSVNIWSELYPYLSIITNLFIINIQNEKIFNEIILYDKIKNNQIAMNDSVAQLKRSFELEEQTVFPPGKKQDQLYNVCQRLANYYQLPLSSIIKKSPQCSLVEQFKQLMDRSKIFYRKVYLTKDWHKGSHEPLLAFDKEKKAPIALLPKQDKGYSYYDGISAEEGECSQEKIGKIYSFAYAIYRFFEPRVIAVTEVIQFGIKYLKKDIMTLLMYFGLVTLLAFIPPILTQIIFDSVIISSGRGQLGQLGLILLIALISINAFELSKRYILLKIEAIFYNQVQAAFWGRVLKLPLAFFRQLTPGELVSRISRLMELRITVSGPLLLLFINALFSFLSFILLIYYCAWAAFTVALLLGVMLLFYKALFVKRLYFERRVVAQQDNTFGMLGEFLSAITKIRLTGAEYRVFFHWSRAFSYLQENLQKSLRLFALTKSFLDIFPLIIFGGVFLTMSMVVQGGGQLSTGSFLAFNAVLIQMLVGLFDFLQEINKIIEKVPHFESTKIFIESVPEVNEGSEEPGELRGEIEISNVSFKYPNSQNIILKGINIKIEAGQYVAIVGPSGSGKSTLLRLLLHFDQPSEGRIYFDNRDLGHIDIDMLRKQIGVVLQNDQLIPGDIFSNISGQTDITLKEAWELAEKVGLAQDINEMPMKMYTIINSHGGGLSGGQKERLLIARAIANRPKILILDEATRALDNVSQKIVVKQLNKMKLTRIVVAHRLSTLLDVDKIYVLESGKLIESGSYEQLMDKKDFFYRMAKRQII